MSNVRRWYIFLVAIISLQAVTWAVIELLRNVLGFWGKRSNEAISFQVAVIVIALPIFLIHWLWAQRLAGADPEEREAVLRRLYLYGTMATLLGPWVYNAYNLIQGLLRDWLAPIGNPVDIYLNMNLWLLGNLTPLLVLGLVWLYHWRVVMFDKTAAPPSDNSALIRRLYLLGFSFSGLEIMVRGAIGLLRWLLYQFGGATAMAGRDALIEPIAGVLVGLPLWVLMWRLAQILFASPEISERESALRKFYLHTIVFFSTLATISGATLIVAGLLRQAFGLTPQGDIRDPLPMVLISALIWAYHSMVLRADVASIPEVPRQAGVRRISWYLVASIGLSAALIGLGGIFSVIIRAISALTFGNDLREQLAWTLSALIAGLPIWALSWRRAQGSAETNDTSGENERNSLVRRIYLYSFLLVATLTILSGLVYIVFRLLRITLGEPSQGNLVADLAQAIAFSGIAAGILAYHVSLLRGEGRRRRDTAATSAAELRVAVLDLTDGAFGRAVIERLRHELPGLALSPIGLNPVAAAAMGAEADPRGLTTQLAEASLIIGPWQAAVSQMSGAEVAQAVGASTAHKVLLPTPTEGWTWAGVDPWNSEVAIGQIVNVVRQIRSGEPIRPVRRMTPLTIVGIGCGVIVLLSVLLIIVSASIYFR